MISVLLSTPLAFTNVLLDRCIVRKLAIRKGANLLIGRALTSVRHGRLRDCARTVIFDMRGCTACHSFCIFSECEAGIIKHEKREQNRDVEYRREKETARTLTTPLKRESYAKK